MYDIIYLDEVDSTNSYLKQRCGELASGTVVTAKFQTAGRGRRGHSWNGSEGMIPLSILFKDAREPETLTARVGLGVCEALESCSGICSQVGIKWPNDIIMENHKVCGILCESIRFGDSFNVICGIGVNISQTEDYFKEAGLPSAASILMLCGVAPDKDVLLRLIAENVTRREAMPFSVCYNDYKSRIINLGREVRIISPNGDRTAFAEDISPNGFLVCRGEEGTFEVNSGEVSVRGTKGYL